MNSLPTYNCHKKVRAGRIVGLLNNALHLALPDDETCTVFVSDSYFVKHSPQVGGYYVRYEDGYESFSPAAAFEGGYALEEK